jgi:hypothetical protein
MNRGTRGIAFFTTACIAGGMAHAVVAGRIEVPSLHRSAGTDAGIRGQVVTDLRWLPGALRRAGLTVVEEPGWAKRGHGAPMRARAVILHHDASPAGPSPDVVNWLVAGYASGADRHYDAQVWVDRAGRWHMIAAGSAQHAGTGRGWGAIRADEGNVDSFGVETDHTTGERWPAGQLASIRKGLAAICARTGWDPMTSVVGHKEYAAGRKTDPAGIDMAQLRRQVTALALDTDLVRQIRAQAGRGDVAAAMLVGAMLEGGRLDEPWPVGDHGVAHGPFQLHGATRADAERPSSAVRIMLPRYRAACATVPAARWRADRRAAAALCAYRAEKPARMYPQDRVRASWAQIGVII